MPGSASSRLLPCSRFRRRPLRALHRSLQALGYREAKLRPPALSTRAARRRTGPAARGAPTALPTGLRGAPTAAFRGRRRRLPSVCPRSPVRAAMRSIARARVLASVTRWQSIRHIARMLR
jgi:hypothetical protein